MSTNTPGASPSFGPLKQVDAGVLNVGYAEAGQHPAPAEQVHNAQRQQQRRRQAAEMHGDALAVVSQRIVVGIQRKTRRGKKVHITISAGGCPD